MSIFLCHNLCFCHTIKISQLSGLNLESFSNCCTVLTVLIIIKKAQVQEYSNLSLYMQTCQIQLQVGLWTWDANVTSCARHVFCVWISLSSQTAFALGVQTFRKCERKCPISTQHAQHITITIWHSFGLVQFVFSVPGSINLLLYVVNLAFHHTCWCKSCKSPERKLVCSIHPFSMHHEYF